MFKIHMEIERRWWEKFLPKAWACVILDHHWRANVRPKLVLWTCLRCGITQGQTEPGGCIDWK